MRADGVVHLWGVFQSAEAVDAVRVAAQNIPGVKHVEDHTEPYQMIPGIWQAWGNAGAVRHIAPGAS
ncbi:BON domain-containing protein [Paraburkholderia strydomiana]